MSYSHCNDCVNECDTLHLTLPGNGNRSTPDKHSLMLYHYTVLAKFQNHSGSNGILNTGNGTTRRDRIFILVVNTLKVNIMSRNGIRTGSKKTTSSMTTSDFL